MRHFVLNIITEKMIMLVLATVFIQLMFTVDTSSQYEFSNQNEPLNKETMMMNDREQPIESNRPASGVKPRLSLSPEMIYFLMKRFANNPKLQEYLKVLKKKKYDESYAEEEPYYDYNYQGKFRF